MKTITQYLAGYLNQEINKYESQNHEDQYFQEGELQEWIKQGMDAYMSTENCEIIIEPRLPEPTPLEDCQYCKKLGETTCAGDPRHRCFEHK